MLASGTDLCLSCHKTLGESLKAGTVHSPVESDCQTCHRPHEGVHAALLTEPQGTLCATCHDVKDAAFSNAHLGIDSAVMNCVGCHAPHASKDPNLFQAQVHAPFVGGSCEECHTVTKR
jgi:predicted CXXCH cytochrome family protein